MKDKWLDERGYIDPEKVSEEDLAAFIKSKPYRKLIDHQRNVISMARKHFADEFNKVDESKGRVLLWNNKNFHAAEAWQEESFNREVYIIRCMPIYDSKIKLKRELHGKLFNNFLFDAETAQLQKFDAPVDVREIPDEDKIPM